MWRILRILCGAFFILAGMPGLILPILPGWLFLALGALLLSEDIPFFDRQFKWMENRVPQIKKPLERVKKFLKGQDDKAT